MLSRLARQFQWNSIAIGFRNHRMFNQSVSMNKAIVTAESHECADSKIDNDSMMTATIKSATHSYGLLSSISKSVKQFSVDQTMTALRTLFDLQKQSNTSISRDDIVRNSDFERLCRSLKRNPRHLELNDAIEALKILSFVGITASSEITMSLLHLVKYQINDMELSQIIFLSFLLRQMEQKNPLVEALQLSLPMLLQTQIGTKIDYENVNQLTNLLVFVSRYRVSDQCIMNIVNALTLHGKDLNLEQARSIVWSLSSTSTLIYSLKCEKLLDNAINAMKRDFDKEEFSTVSTTLEKMISKYLYDIKEYEKFYDEALYNKCADFVVMNNLGFQNATFLQRQMNKLGFVNMELLKYMLREVEKYSGLIVEGKPISLVSLVTAMSQANYRPDNWSHIQSLILESNLLNKNKRLTIPWVRLSTELLSLGVECHPIWDKIFSKEFIDVHLTRDRSPRLLRILELYQHIKVMTNYNVDNRIEEKYLNEAKKLMLSIVDHPMQQYVESAFGGSSFVYTKVRTQVGNIIDHVIAFDKGTMEPVRIGDGCNHDVFYDDITMDDVTKQYVAVITFPHHCYCINIPILRGIYELKLLTYERMGITVVAINHSTWKELLDHEIHTKRSEAEADATTKCFHRMSIVSTSFVFCVERNYRENFVVRKWL